MAADIPAAVEAIRPEGVVFLGLLNPCPLELLCQLKSRKPHETVNAAIIRSADELGPRRESADCSLKDAFWRFQSLFQSDQCPSERAGRKFLVDLRARELSVGGRSLTFSPMEFRLLVFFLRYPGVIYSRQELLQRTCSHESAIDPQIIDVMVRRIRRKIEINVQSPDLLRTARGLGYKFTDNGHTFLDRITGGRFISWPSGLSNL